MIDTKEKGAFKKRRNSNGKFLKETSLQPLKVLKVLYVSIFGLSAVSLTISFIKYVTPPASSNWINILMTFFYFDKENNVPTYFSSVILLVAAVLLGYTYFLKSQTKDNYFRYWAILGLGFLFMSMDEFIGFHEYLNLHLQQKEQFSGFLYYPWVIAGIGVVAVVSLVFIPFLLSLNSRLRNRFLIAGFIYVGGVIGVELLGGYVTDNFGGRETFLYAIVSHLEEILEMVGISYFIYALVSHIKSYKKELNTFTTSH